MAYFLQAVAGAVGGFTAWLLAISLDTDIQLPGLRVLHPFLIVLVHIFFGAMAAFIGPFLANTKENEPRRFLIFCLLCGMAWRPMLDAGQNWVVNSVKTDKVRNLRQDLEVITQPSSFPDRTPEMTAEVAQRAEALLQATETLPSQSERQASNRAVRKAMDSLMKSTENPASTEMPVEALRNLHQTAVRTDQADLARQALVSLDQISKRGATPELREQARLTLLQIRRAPPP